MKKTSMMLLSLALAGGVAAPSPAAAHHGAAAYDTGHLTTMSATVAALDWKNPHALLHFDVADDNGRVTTWTAETAGLVILIRAGWTREAVKPGDRVIVSGHRAANGSNTMLLKRLVLSTGRELTSIIPAR
jgi:hypothetical protein